MTAAVPVTELVRLVDSIQTDAMARTAQAKEWAAAGRKLDALEKNSEAMGLLHAATQILVLIGDGIPV